MSYGLIARNELGEDLFGGPLYWIRDEGTTDVYTRSDHIARAYTIKPSLAGTTADRNASSYYAVYNTAFTWTQATQANATSDHYLANGIYAHPANPIFSCLPLANMGPGELAFFDLTTDGVFHVLQPFNRLPEYDYSSFLYVASWNNTSPLNCYICSTTPGATSGNYGMKVFAADGTVEFDSRQKYPRIQDHFYISQSTAVDILVNGTTVDLTLSAPISSPKVSCSQWAHGQRNTNFATNGQIARILMRKLNDTTIRLERIGESGSGGSSFHFRYTHDATIVVAH